MWEGRSGDRALQEWQGGLWAGLVLEVELGQGDRLGTGEIREPGHLVGVEDISIRGEAEG